MRVLRDLPANGECSGRKGDRIDAVGAQIFFDAAVPRRKVTRSTCIAANAWFVA